MTRDDLSKALRKSFFCSTHLGFYSYLQLKTSEMTWAKEIFWHCYFAMHASNSYIPYSYINKKTCKRWKNELLEKYIFSWRIALLTLAPPVTRTRVLSLDKKESFSLSSNRVSAQWKDILGNANLTPWADVRDERPSVWFIGHASALSNGSNQIE